MLYGAILGDIAGSTHEFVGVKKYNNYPLFVNGSTFTDDTICTIAVADWIMRKETALKDVMKEWCHSYPDPVGGYGGRFAMWLYDDDGLPYNSFGNGSAMRVSPVGWVCESMNETMKMAKETAMITHNHTEGIKGAQAIACSIFMLKNGCSKKDLKDVISFMFGYNLDVSVGDIHRLNYHQKESCQDTVPEAIISFIESIDFESCLRNAFWCNKDTDTVGAIAGSLAEAYYGVTDDMKDIVHNTLDQKLCRTLLEFENAYAIK